MKQVYTSIDIGSDTVKVVVAELFNNKLNLLASSSIKSNGIKKGLIADAELASESIKKAINSVEEMLGIKIKKVITTIPSYYTEFEMLKGSIKLEDNVPIDGNKISELLNETIKLSKIEDKIMVTILPIDFMVDDKNNIKDPKGMTGTNFSTRAIMVHTAKKNLLSVIRILEKLDLEIVDVSLNCISDMYAVRDKEIKEKIGALINIGHETTTVSLYNKGIIVKSSVIGIGGKNIENDISYIYKINEKDSSKIKEKFALAHKKFASVNDYYEVDNNLGEKIKINQFEVSEIVSARIEEILVTARKEINMLTKHDIDYILITGGVSNMTNFDIIAKEILGNETKIGEIRLVGLRHNKYSSSIGDIVYFINKLKIKGKDYSMISKDDSQILSSSKKGLLSENSMIGKVFGCFFDDKED